MIRAFFLALVLFAMLMFNMLVFDNGVDTVVKNQAAVAQVNGGNVEYVANRAAQRNTHTVLYLGEGAVFLVLVFACYGGAIKKRVFDKVPW